MTMTTSTGTGWQRQQPEGEDHDDGHHSTQRHASNCPWGRDGSNRDGTTRHTPLANLRWGWPNEEAKNIDISWPYVIVFFLFLFYCLQLIVTTERQEGRTTTQQRGLMTMMKEQHHLPQPHEPLLRGGSWWNDDKGATTSSKALTMTENEHRAQSHNDDGTTRPALNPAVSLFSHGDCSGSAMTTPMMEGATTSLAFSFSFLLGPPTPHAYGACS